jgi:hypothetical protein
MQFGKDRVVLEAIAFDIGGFSSVASRFEWQRLYSPAL